jgi:uncharacterized membrane protein (UPF0127 family)
MVLFALLLSLTAPIQQQPQAVCFGDRCFKVECAVTMESQQKGLMYRESMAPDDAMLFIYQEENMPVMYMKNMKFPLDLIWLDRKQTVVSIAKNVPPCQSDPCELYKPAGRAMYVLEVNAGTTENLRLKPGDEARFEFFHEKNVQKIPK